MFSNCELSAKERSLSTSFKTSLTVSAKTLHIDGKSENFTKGKRCRLKLQNKF